MRHRRGLQRQEKNDDSHVSSSVLGHEHLGLTYLPGNWLRAACDA